MSFLPLAALSLVALLPVGGGCASTARSSFAADSGADKRSKDEEKDGGSDTFGESDGGYAADAECERELDVGSLELSDDRCTVNEHVEYEKATLRYACNGGKATATFGEIDFEGSISADGFITLKAVAPFVFNGCNWVSTEIIQGDLESGTLDYQYTEKPKTSCPDTACNGSGELEVSAGEVTVVK